MTAPMSEKIRSQLGEMYPYESHFLKVGEHSLHYIDEGPRDAEPVVMVHGNPSWSFYFRALIEAMKGQYRVIALDHIGCGMSDKPADEDYDYCLENRVDNLAALLEHLGIQDNLSLILHDWGGMIGLAYASRHPERLKRLVALNTAGFRLPEGKSFPTSLKLARGPLGALLVRGFNAFCKGAIRYCVTRTKMSRQLQRAYLAPYDSWSHRIAVHRFVQDIPLTEGHPSYKLVMDVDEHLVERFKDTPKLIVWGEKDFVFDVHFLNEWIRRFPEAEVLRFADGGHYILEDAPEAIVPRVLEFFKKHPLTASDD